MPSGQPHTHQEINKAVINKNMPTPEKTATEGKMNIFKMENDKIESHTMHGMPHAPTTTTGSSKLKDEDAFDPMVYLKNGFDSSKYKQKNQMNDINLNNVVNNMDSSKYEHKNQMNDIHLNNVVNNVDSSKYKPKNQINDINLDNVIEKPQSNDIKPLEDSRNEIYFNKAGIALRNDGYFAKNNKLKEQS
jgi:hypothetical protein